MATNNSKKVYRLEGLTCTSCASKFEKNVKDLPCVTDAQVNFGASKITVYGNASVNEIEKAGAFDKIQVREEHQVAQETTPFWKKSENIQLFFSFLLLVGGWISSRITGETSIPTISLYIASILLGGTGLFIEGIKNLVRFQFDMSVLMTIAILGATAIGEWSEGATVVILFAISEALERFSMDRARQSIRSLMDIAPKQALIRRDEVENYLPVEQIQVDDVMIVKPSEKIAMDGIVIKGTSTVNQAPITGESIPVEKQPDDEVFAGTLNEEGLLEIRVTKKVEDTTLSKIIHLVEEAQAERAPAQAFVDRFAKYYTPTILLLGLAIAMIPPLFTGEWSQWIYRGLALLVVGCPCALVVSTPVAIVTAIGNAARNGVLIKGGIHLENIGSLTTIAFDKTGTLTKGTPVVTDFINLSNHSKTELYEVATALEQHSLHPLASAIVRFGEEHQVNRSIELENFTSMTGKGVMADLNKTRYLIGSPHWFQEIFNDGIPNDILATIQSLQQQGKTVMLLGTQSEILAMIAVQDEVRESSAQVIKQLYELGIKRTVMLTGDHPTTAHAIGSQLKISEIYADLLPDQKLEKIKQLHNSKNKVAMIGDGVNDAPALAAATVGIAMGGAGTDTALETADLALMGDDLRKLPFTISLSRKTLQIIKQNIIFALGLKVLALLLIIPGLLTLWLAVFADMGGTLIVTLNALRLLRIRTE